MTDSEAPINTYSWERSTGMVFAISEVGRRSLRLEGVRRDGQPGPLYRRCRCAGTGEADHNAN